MSHRMISSVRVVSLTTDKKNKILEKPSGIDIGCTDIPIPNTFQSTPRHTDVSDQDLSGRWFISVAQAAKTL